MPKKVFTVAAPGDLVLEWRGLWKDMTVSYQGKQIGDFADKRELTVGKYFALPDGSPLRVFLKEGFGNVHLDVSHNGAPVRGSDGDPEVQVKTAAGIVYFIGGLNIVLALVAELGKVTFLQNAGIGWPSAAFGLLFLGLGFATSKKSRLALGVAIGLFVLDGALSVASMAGSLGPNQTPPIGPIMMRIFLVIPMVKAFGAMGKRPA